MLELLRSAATRLFGTAWALCAVAALTGTAAAIAGQVREGILLNRWTANNSPRFESLGSLLRGTASKGWLASEDEFVDFVLQFEFRAVEPDSEGAVIVRGWDGKPGSTGYRIALAEPTGRASRLGTVTSRRTKKDLGGPGNPGPSFTGSPGAAGEWHRLEVRCENDRVAVALDGTGIGEANGSEPLAGYVGLEVIRGVMEFRREAVLPLAWGVHASSEASQAPASLPSDPGITLPRLAQEVSPRYSAGAMRRKVQGTVVLDAVVGADGLVNAVRIVRALDPALDAQAVGAARRWRFTPGQRDSVPVPVLVTIELTFTLK